MIYTDVFPIYVIEKIGLILNVFLVHGSLGKPFENWFPWLEEELTKANINCTIPSFPTPENQNYSNWEKLMDYYCDLNVVNKDTVLIGYSCGAIFLAHYIATHKINVSGLIVVSGYNNFISGFEFMDNLNKSFYIQNESIMDVSKYVKKIYSFYSDDDPNIPQDTLKTFSQILNARSICVSHAGHFNEAAGYTKCQIVLDTLLEIFKNEIVEEV